MTSSILGSRRSTVEIVHAILSLCDKGEVKKTTIMYRSNLSYNQLCRYLAMLCEDDLIAKNRTGYFEITPTGQKVLKRMSKAVSTLRELRNDLSTSPVHR